MSGSRWEHYRFTGKYEFSYEMMRFLVAYGDGALNANDPQTRKCASIAERKGCYNPTLTNSFGYMTNEGYEAWQDAQYLQAKLHRWWRQNDKDVTNWKPSRMDEIVPLGTIPGYSVRVLRYLFELLPKDEQKAHTHLEDVKETVYTVPYEVIDGTAYGLMAAVRHNMYARTAVEKLIKFGLVDLVTLPKTNPLGRGRAPVGFTISENGKLFHVAKLEEFHPEAVANKRRRLDYERSLIGHSDRHNDIDPDEVFLPRQTKKSGRAQQNSDMSDTSDAPYIPQPRKDSKSVAEVAKGDPTDIVGGENLRELFGG